LHLHKRIQSSGMVKGAERSIRIGYWRKQRTGHWLQTAVPQVVKVLEPGSIEFQIVEFWQLKCTATISTTKMAESSSFNSRGQRYAGSK
jgi:hypothetical protein